MTEQAANENAPRKRGQAPFMSEDQAEERYLRNATALAPEQTAALHDKRVLVAGCGGLGGYAIEILERIGVGTIIAVDNDAFEVTNLNRQLLATQETIGRRKAECAAKRAAQVNPTVNVIPVDTTIADENARDLISGADCVLDALDNVEARFTLARACRKARIPIVYGAIAGWYGQVCTVYPDDASFATIYGAAAGEGVQKHEGVLGPSAACTAAFQSAEVVKALLGTGDSLRNRLLMIDLLYGSCESIELR